MKQFPFRLILLCFLAGCSAAFAAASGQTYWKGASDCYQVEWSKTDLKAVDAKTGQTVFSARELAEANYSRIAADLKAAEQYEEDYELLSLVGPVMSVEYHCRVIGKPHTGKQGSSVNRAVTKYIAVNLKNAASSRWRFCGQPDSAADPRQPAIQLSDLFSEKELLTALTNDTVVQSTIETEGITNLNQLVKALSGKSLPAPDMCGRFDAQLLNEFGIHHLRGSKAAVRLGISGADPRPEILSELGVVVPIRADWQNRFILAAEGKEGILTGALKRQTGNARTRFQFK